MLSIPAPAVIGNNRPYFGGQNAWDSDTDGASTIADAKDRVGLPQLPVTQGEHKACIILAGYASFFCCGGLPIILYFDLKYATRLDLQAGEFFSSACPCAPGQVLIPRSRPVLAIPMAIFGAFLLLCSSRRVWRLVHGGEKYQPIGTGQQLDYFQYNLSFSLFYTIPLIIIGVLVESFSKGLAVRLLALPLSLILVQACLQLVVRAILYNAKAGSVKPATFRIVEDVVAVDGGCGSAFRAAWQERYTASSEMRHLLSRSDWIWGLSGLVVSIALIVVIWLVDVNIAFALGKSSCSSPCKRAQPDG